MDLEPNAFTLLNVEYDVPCVFQIWELQNELRVIKSLPTKSKYFDFVKKQENPDFSMRRVGVYAGKIYNEISDKSEQSHYFIKASKEVKELFENITWNHNNTVGPRSISKTEIVHVIDELISKNF